ncbi:MAG: hypothetical protein ACP5QT_00295 [Brevinematia bacterium]
MNKNLSVALFFLLFTSPLLSLTNIIDEGKRNETNTHTLNSYGILCYGLHSNTFHLRNAFLKYNLNLSDINEVGNVSFFITFKGLKDTHIPETNYPPLLNNIEFYDYGVNLWLKFLYLSFRGAANYTQNPDTFLLLMPYRINNETEFDSPTLYKKLFYSSPGIRIGIDTGDILVAYSQGDYRHLIPSGVIIKFKKEDFYIRIVSLFYHNNPLVYEAENLYFIHQASIRKDFIYGELKIMCLMETTYYTDNDFLIRLEEGISYKKFILSLREIYNIKDGNFIFEASIKRDFYGVFSIGIQASTDNRYYLVTEINF